MVNIVEVTTRRQLDRFISFPYILYRYSAHWIPPIRFDERNTLDARKNPSFEYCEARYWLAIKDGDVAGRIAAIINHRFIEKHRKQYMRFGWIDFIDDRSVSKGLLEAVEAWAEERGMEAIHGPLGFTDLDREGMLVKGFDELGTFPMIYNYPYYPVHMESHGYRKDIDWLEYEVNVPESIDEKYFRISAQVARRHSLRVLKPRSRKDFLPYANGVFDVINKAYAHLYGVVELDVEQKKTYTDQYFTFLHKDFTKIILNEHDQVIAFIVSMPSLSKALQKVRGRLLPFGFIHVLQALRKPSYIDFYLAGVLPEYQKKGVHAMFITEMFASAKKHGIISCETSGELETNREINALTKRFEHRQHKRRRCYIKHI